MENTDVLSRFSVSSKQWKQQIQFSLQGKDYNEHCVWKSHQGISVNPFYNRETSQIPSFEKSVRPQKLNLLNAFYFDRLNLLPENQNFIIGSASFETKKKILSTLSKKTKWFLPLDRIDNFFLENSAENVVLWFDPIANLSKNGRFYHSKEVDFSFWKSIFYKQNSFCIDARFLTDAGASNTQQIAYAMAILSEYFDLLEQMPQQKISVYIRTGIVADFYFEWAKIRAMHWVFDSILKNYQNIDLQIVAEPSLRYDDFSFHQKKSNDFKHHWAIQSAILGGANFVVLPYQYAPNFEMNPSSQSYFIKNISYQMAKQSLELYKEIVKNKGYLLQFKQQIIQRKIREKAELSGLYFSNSVSKSSFVKNSKRVKKYEKVFFEPILPNFLGL